MCPEPQKESTMHPEMAVRLFIAASIPTQLAAQVREAASTQAGLPHWRMAPMAQWHVTALFIGERPASDLPLMTEALHQARTQQACTLKDGRLVAMPEGSPSMLWLRFEPHEGLTQLHHVLAHACGAPPSPFHPYWPHITLARSKARVAPWHDERVVLHALPVDELVLFRSDPGAGHRIHTALASCRLSRTGPIAPGEAP